VLAAVEAPCKMSVRAPTRGWGQIVPASVSAPLSDWMTEEPPPDVRTGAVI
jgi:hypothetical protein